MPTPLRISTLTRKREEYQALVNVAFARGRDGLDQQIWHQIEIDVPRTRPGIRLWMEGGTQRVSTIRRMTRTHVSRGKYIAISISHLSHRLVT